MEKKLKASGSYEAEGSMSGAGLGAFFGFIFGGPVGAIFGALLGAPTGKALSQREAKNDMKNSSESSAADELAETWLNNRYDGENNIDISFGGPYCKRTYSYELEEKDKEIPYSNPSIPIKNLDLLYPKPNSMDFSKHLNSKFSYPTFEDIRKSIDRLKSEDDEDNE